MNIICKPRALLVFAVFFSGIGSQMCFSQASSTDNKRLIYYNLNLHSGMGLPHHPSQVYFNNEYIKSIELNTWFHNITDKEINYSIPGAGYFFTSLGNREIYGNAHAVYLSMLNPMFSDKFPVQLKVGLGAAYATKKFDLENNYFNRAIGSHLNIYVQLALTGRVPLIEDRVLFRPGISFHHISTGAVVAPNQGLNLLTFNAGIDFSTGKSYPVKPGNIEVLPAAGKNRYSIIYAPGIKQVDRRIDKQIFVSSLILDYGYEYRPGRSIGMGISFFYNDSWAYIPYNRVTKDESLSPFQSALHLSMQMNKGPLAFILHPGIYIYMPAKDKPYFTNRLGVKYSLENNITFQFSIKAHWFAIADYIEWGIGYEFNR